ncbi:MAG: hypothetical protein Q4C70_11910 [Planctomycetia bacterium]|nr:hypothetical protein [Planctomycetia bacterium]
MFHRSFLIAVLFTLCGCCFSVPSSAQEVDCPYPSTKIWDLAKYNAFTDIIQFKGYFYCTFRESSYGHVVGSKTGVGDGEVRIIRSVDGEKWESVAILKRKTFDLRDSKLSITPDGRIMVSMGGSIYVNGRLEGRISQVSFSDANGLNFSDPQDTIIDESIRSNFDWLWRVTWHEGVGYGVVYQNMPVAPHWHLYLVKTTDGIHYQNIKKLEIVGCPNETTVRFAPNGDMKILIRRECAGRGAYLGTAKAPYTDWKFTDIGVFLGGPNFIYLPDGRILAGGRVRGELAGLGIIDDAGKFQPLYALARTWDSSYPGFTIRDGVVYVSYYANRNGKTDIYLTKIPLDGLKK